jgi:hypothetical protein
MAKWAVFNGIPGAIGEAKRKKEPKAKATIPERELQGMAESLCDALGVRYFRIPDTLLGLLKTGTSIPMWAKVMVAKYFRGVPDLMLFKKDQSNGMNLAMFIEIKTEAGKVSQCQENWHKGLNVRVTRGWKETELAIKEFANV